MDVCELSRVALADIRFPGVRGVSRRKLDSAVSAPTGLIKYQQVLGFSKVTE